MSQAADNLADTDVSLVWRQLSERIDALVSAWEQSNQPPLLADFMPAGPPALRRLTLVEAVKVDLEYRWQNRRFPKLVEEYVARVSRAGRRRRRALRHHLRGVPHSASSRAMPYRSSSTASVFRPGSTSCGGCFELECPEQTSSLVPAERVPTFEVGAADRRFRLALLAGQGGLRHRVSGAAALDAAAGGAQDFARPRLRAADARAARPSAHRARLRSAAVVGPQAAAAVHAVHRRRHAAKTSSSTFARCRPRSAMARPCWTPSIACSRRPASSRRAIR